MTATIALPVHWYRFHDLAQESGLAAGLRALAEQFSHDTTTFGPSGHALVLADPATAAATAAALLFTVELGADAVMALRLPRGTGTECSPQWAAGICWVRLGASRWLLRHCVAHARMRRIGQDSLLQQQIAQATVAEALTEQLEAEALLDGGGIPGAAVLAQAHARIQAADRIALPLLGASGFQAGLPSHTAWVSELLADVYPGHGGGPR